MSAKWDWVKLRHVNYTGKLHYGDCQVISAVNAYYVLMGKVAYKTEREYRALCKLAGACYGPATSIEKIYKKLGIERYKTTYFPGTESKIRFTHPIECTVWHVKYGFHSILIVDSAPKCNAIRVTNFQYETTTDGWMFEQNLSHILHSDKGWTHRMKRCRRIRLRRS